MITKKYYKLIRVSYADEGYFCLTNVSDSMGNVKIDNRSGSSGGSANYEYSTDGATWNAYTVGNNVQVDPKSNIYWRYAGSGSTVNGTFQFYFDFDCNASGNLMSLFSKTDFATYTGTWQAGYLFSRQTHLLKADFNLGSVTSVGNNGMQSMFSGCTSLTTAPDLSNLTSIGNHGFDEAFRGCTSLTTAPDLSNVTSVGTYGMYEMFSGCSALSQVYAPTITWDINLTIRWLQSVSNTGTLYADASIASTIPTNSASGCPSGWTVATI